MTTKPTDALTEEVEREMRDALNYRHRATVTKERMVADATDVAVALVERHTARVARECAEQMDAALAGVRAERDDARRDAGAWCEQARGAEQKVAEERARWGHVRKCMCGNIGCANEPLGMDPRCAPPDADAGKEGA